MIEWVLGITGDDCNWPHTWKYREPLWEDEKIIATSSDTFYDLMNELCETAIRNRREKNNDYGIMEHSWKMKITSYEEAAGTKTYKDDEEFRKAIIIQSALMESCQRGKFSGDGSSQYVKSKTKLCKEFLPEDSVIEIIYDPFSETTLFLKVLSMKHIGVRYITVESNQSDMSTLQADLESIPAYHLPKDKQVDFFFPNFSKAFLGNYVLLHKEGSSEQHIRKKQKIINRRAIGCISMGLSSRINSEEDTTFCGMENCASSGDLLFCPAVLDLTEFLEAAEESWTPSKSYNYDSISRFIIGSNDEKTYQNFLQDQKEARKQRDYGPLKVVPTRLSKDRKRPAFQFDKLFPRTAKMLACGKFRWFQYKNDVLRVIIGRGVGPYFRQFEKKQILKTWNYKFKSFHELLCAVETSWVWKGKALTADMDVSPFDDDLGPNAGEESDSDDEWGVWKRECDREQ